MAKRRRKRKSAKKHHKKRKSHHGGHIPLRILERRAKKLNAIVKKRGGSV